MLACNSYIIHYNRASSLFAHVHGVNIMRQISLRQLYFGGNNGISFERGRILLNQLVFAGTVGIQRYYLLAPMVISILIRPARLSVSLVT